jgi:hypothetical protein
VKLIGEANQLGDRRNLQLLHDVRPVKFHGTLRDANFGGDLLVELARRPLARGRDPH